MLKIEVVRFEAQDVITASAEASPACICGEKGIHWVHPSGKHYLDEDTECPASVHSGCPANDD